MKLWKKQTADKDNSETKISLMEIYASSSILMSLMTLFPSTFFLIIGGYSEAQ